jgi:hypothetical protein
MAETDFLSFLVDETLKLQKAGEVSLSSLERKLKDYDLPFLKGEFLPQTQVLRFIAPFGLIDVPINWSHFAIDSSTSNSDVVLSSDNDPDHLLMVLQARWKSDLKKILITHADGFCYFVGLREGDENHLHDILNPQEWLKAS